MTRRGLTEQQRAILAFAARTWRSNAARNDAARELFGLTEMRYHQTLNAIIDLPAALEADPVLVNRLRRQRETARLSRSAKRLRIWQAA